MRENRLLVVSMTLILVVAVSGCLGIGSDGTASDESPPAPPDLEAEAEETGRDLPDSPVHLGEDGDETAYIVDF